MRAAFIAAAFAASVIAVPFEKRDYVVTDTHVDIVYVTEYETVTGGQAAPTTHAAPSPSPQYHWGHNHWWGHNPNKGETKKATVTTTPKATWAPPPTTHHASPPTTHEAPPPHTTWTTSPSGPAPTGYAAIAVHHHNIHRANHSASNIEWDEGLAGIAAQIASSCVYAHNTQAGGGGYGQNIAAGVDETGIDRIITDMFYNGEVNYYDGLYGEAQPDMSNFEHWGHFSQIVWKATSSVGCATHHCPGGLANVGGNVPPYFTVCNYKSPGNFANEYGANVGRPLGEPSVIVS